MEERQLKINKSELKNFAENFVYVHGLCKCGFYLSGKVLSPIFVGDNGEISLLHTHFTKLCPKCGSLINLIDVSKEPLKKRD